jgi:hypothetical protein
MARSWDADFEKKAIACINYRQFMKLFFDKKNSFKSPRAMSFQQFSQRSGLSSRSFAADILAGRKKITPLSLEKVILGLSLGKLWADYFRALVATEEPRFWNEKLSSSDYKKKCDQIRARLLKKGTVVRAGDFNDNSELDILAMPEFPLVFASLGSLEKGASLEEIVNRSRLKPYQIAEVLRSLIQLNWVQYDSVTQRYFAKPAFLEFVQMGSDKNFEKAYLNALNLIKSRFVKLSNRSDQTFLTQTFAIKKSRVSELNHRIKDVILEFCDYAEDCDGDTIGELLVSFNHI